MLKASKVKNLSVSELFFDFNTNVREEDNYDIPQMIDGIVEFGRILKPLVVHEKVVDGKKVNLVLQGNRRGRAALEIFTNKEKYSEELRKEMSKLPCMVYTDLTPEEELTLVCDHGGEKPISRWETVKSVWRMAFAMMSMKQIANLAYWELAKFTGKTKKAEEVSKLPYGKERDAALVSWLKGTLDDWILRSLKFGPFVREQFELTMRNEDGRMPEGRALAMECSRERISALSRAKSLDESKEGKGWTVDGGGETFNALIEKFKTEDATGVDSGTDGTPKRLTPKQLREKAGMFITPALRNAFLAAAGDEVSGLGEADKAMVRMNEMLNVIATGIDGIKVDVVREGFRLLLSGTPEEMASYINGVSK